MALPSSSRAAAAVAASTLVLLGGCGSSDPTAAERAAVGKKTLAGLQQQGSMLGPVGAPATLVIFSRVDDLRLRDFLDRTLPTLKPQLITPGKLNVQVRTLGDTSTTGADSVPLAKLVQGAGLQGRFWSALVSVGARYIGTAGPSLTAQVVKDSQPLDPGRLRLDAASPRVARAVVHAGELATAAGVRGFGMVLQTAARTSAVDPQPASTFVKRLRASLAG